MKYKQYRLSATIRSLRCRSEAAYPEYGQSVDRQSSPVGQSAPPAQSAGEAPFREGDVVQYREAPHRPFIVAHCYLRNSGNGPQWIVAEINADTHSADELQRVMPG
jgi:hypothetical protein